MMTTTPTRADARRNDDGERRPLPSYVLVTPALNEETYIENAIRSVISQTVLPVRWVIVSDGSTDRTDDIVQDFASRHAWIEWMRMPEHRRHNFAAKVECFKAGYARVAGVAHDIVGNLDADITFAPDYMEFLLGKFAEDPGLGVAGTPFTERGVAYDFRFASTAHVSGACQLFRRTCFEEIGGYIPIRGGAIDWAAVTTARMRGWRTRTFTEKTCVHHRPIGTGGGSRLSVMFRQGRKDYYVGNHPAWEMLRAAHQARRQPVLFGGISLLCGYTWAFLTRVPSPIPPDVRAFHRSEQMARLRLVFSLGNAASTRGQHVD